MLKSMASALFQVPYPLSPLLATHAKIAGCMPTLSVLERSSITLESRLRPENEKGQLLAAPAVQPLKCALVDRYGRPGGEGQPCFGGVLNVLLACRCCARCTCSNTRCIADC